jgi:hypothetical protein
MTPTTTALPTQEQIDRIAATFAPDVVRIRMMIGHDWADYPAIFFRVILSDDAARNRLGEVTNTVRDRIVEEFRIRETDHYPYFRWRSQREQEALREPSWDIQTTDYSVAATNDTIPALPTQKQIDRIAATFAPDVVRIRMTIWRDWADYPAIFFRVILSDDAARNRLGTVTKAVEEQIVEELHIRETGHHPYFRWRSQSEQEALREPSWDKQTIDYPVPASNDAVSALPTQEQIDRIATTFAPDVVRIRMMIWRDWADYPAIFFRVILSDAAARDRLIAVTQAVKDRITEELHLYETDHYPYFKWR